MNLKVLISLFAIFLVSFLSSASALGQGGTGRETGNSNSNKTAAPTNKPRVPPTRSTKGNRSTSTAKEPEESSATLDETLNWIGARLATFTFWQGFMVGDSGMATEGWTPEDLPGSPSYRIDGCSVTVNRSVKDRYVGDRQIEIALTFADIDPASITVFANGDEYWLQLRSANPTLKLVDSYEGRKLSGVSAHFDFRKQDDAKSFERAIKHAVKLCGGKPSKF